MSHSDMEAADLDSLKHEEGAAGRKKYRVGKKRPKGRMIAPTRRGRKQQKKARRKRG